MEEKLLADFKELELAGKGTISVVYKGKYKSSNKTYAIKYLKAQTKDLYDLFLREIGIQRGISHPNVVPIYIYDHDKSSLEALYTMPFLRSLRNIMENATRRPDLSQVVHLLRDVSNALDHVKRSETLAHGKIKPENVFYNERTSSYQLADWSGHLSFRKNGSIRKRPEGTLSYDRKKHIPNSIYEAPEAQMSLDASSKDKLCSYKADVYSFGITILEFCGFEHEKLLALNSAASDNEFKRAHQDIGVDLTNWYCNDKLTDILMRMTNRWSYQRPSAFEIFLHVEAIGRKDEDKNSFQESFIEIDLGGGEKTSVKEEQNTVREEKAEDSIVENRDESRPAVELNRLKTSFEGKYDWSVQREEEGPRESELINNSKIKKAKIFDREKLDSYEHPMVKTDKHLAALAFKIERSNSTKEETNDTGVFKDVILKSTKTGETMMTANDVLKFEGNINSPGFEEEVKEEKDEDLNSRYKKLQETQLKPSSKKDLNKLAGQSKDLKRNRISKFKTFIGTFGTGLSSFGNSLNDLGTNLTDLGKKALDFGEDNLNSISNVSKKAISNIENIGLFTTRKGSGDLKADTSMTSPKSERIFSPNQFLMTSKLELPKNILSVDSRKSLLSPGDFGEIENESDEELELEFTTSNDPKPNERNMIKPTDRSITKIHTFGGVVTSTSWSPSGRYITVGSLDHSVKILDSETMQFMANSGYTHLEAVLSVAWSPDGGEIASGSDDGSLKVFSFQTNKISYSFDELFSGSISSVCWSPDGDHIASSSMTTIKIVDFHNKKRVKSFKDVHREDIKQISWNKNGQYLASVSYDKTIKIIESDTGAVVYDYEILEGEPNVLAWSRINTVLAVGSSDQSVKIFDVLRREICGSFDEAMASITALAWSADGRFLVSGAEDGFIRVYEYTKKVLHLTLEHHKSQILSLSWSPDSENLISSSKESKLIYYNMSKRSIVKSWIGGLENAITSVAWYKDGTYFAVGSAKGTLRIYEIQSMNISATSENIHSGAIKCISWSSDGKFLATGSEDCSLQVFSSQELKVIFTYPQLHQADINTIDWSLDSKFLLTGSSDNSVKVIDVKKQAVVYHFSEIHTDSIRSVAWSPNSKLFACCSNDWQVSITNLEKAKTEHLYSETYYLSFVNWTSDGKSLISGSEGGTIKIYDLIKKSFTRELNTRPDSVDVVYGYSFAKDAQIIALLSIDPAIKVFDCQDKSLLFHLEGVEQERVCSLALSNNGKKMVVGLQDGSMRIYNLTF